MILIPLKKYTISQKFGVNGDFYKKYFNVIGHNGVDIVSFHGDEILAPEDGIVFKVYDLDHGSVTKGFGLHMLSDNKDGTFTEWICWHTMSNLCVKQGDIVKQGQVLGHEGDSGQVYVNNEPVPDSAKGKIPYPGTHLHWGKRIVKPTDNTTINFCISNADGTPYRDANGAYEIIDYGNGFNGCVDPMIGAIDYEEWLIQKAMETAIVGSTLAEEVPEPQKTTLLQSILSLLQKVVNYFIK